MTTTLSWMKSASYKYFGFNLPDEKPLNIIITPILPLFKMLCVRGSISTEHIGLVISGDVVFDNTCFLIIKTTPGNTIVDLIKLLKGRAEYICLIGLAGSLKENIIPGQVISPSKAVCSTNLNYEITLSCNEEKNGKICQTDGLIQSRRFYLRLQKRGVDFIDMESYYFAGLSQKYSIRSRVINIISDNPLLHPFFEDRIRFNPDIEKIFHLISLG